MKYVMTAIALVSLSACMNVEGDSSVTRAATGVNNCAHLGGMAAMYMQGPNVRCGPQSELPYTVR